MTHVYIAICTFAFATLATASYAQDKPGVVVADEVETTDDGEHIGSIDVGDAIVVAQRDEMGLDQPAG